MKDKSLSVIFCSDDRGVTPQLEVALWSLLRHASPDTCYDVIVLSCGISPDNRSRLKGLLARLQPCRHTLRFVETESVLLPWANVLPCRGWPLAAWARCFVDTLLPDTHGKVLYLDIDVYVCEDLSGLFATDLGEAVIGAVCEARRGDRKSGDNFSRIRLPQEACCYFNSGVLLMDLDRFREEEIARKLVSFAQRQDIRLHCPDQDVLNGVLWDRVYFLHPRWNWSDGRYERAIRMRLDIAYWCGNPPVTILEAALKPGILHFWGPRKPWVCNHRPEGTRYAAAMRELGLLTGALPGTTCLRKIQNRCYALFHACLRMYFRARLAIYHRKSGEGRL